MKKLLIMTAFLFVAYTLFAEFYYVTFYTQGLVTTKTKKYELPKVIKDNMDSAFFEWKGNNVSITVKVDDKQLDKIKKELEKDGITVKVKVIPTATVTATRTK